MSRDTIEGLLQQGSIAFQSEAYLNAFLICDCGLHQQPDHALLWGWKGRALTQMTYGHLDDRRNQLPDEYCNTWIAGKNVIEWYQASHREAQACLDRALELASDNPELWQFLAEFWLQQGYYHNRDEGRRVQAYTKALQTIEQSIVLTTDNPTFWKTKITVSERLYQHEIGLQSAERLVQLTPEDAAAWNTHAQFLRYLERHEAALASYEQALALAPEEDAKQRERAYLGRGYVLEALGRSEEALSSYEQALQYPRPGYRLHRAEDLRHRLALKNLDRTIEMNPQDWEAWYAKAQQYVKRENYQAAIPCYDQVLSIQPDSVKILKERSAAHLWVGNEAAASADIERVLSLQPDYWEGWYQKGKILSSTEQYEAAIVCYDQVLAPQEKLGRFEAALASYNRVLSLNPDDFQTLINRANVLLQLGRYTESLADCNRALELKPNYEKAFYTNAIICTKQQDLEQVFINLREYVRLVTNYADYAEELIAEPAFASLRTDPEFQSLIQS